jgi:hypothetical protein
MFFVGDKPHHREQKIRRYLEEDPMIAILLAAANVEWTIGRCIIFFSISPNIEVRERLAKCHGLDKYKELWKDELTLNDSSIPLLTQVIKKWPDFRNAFVLRHRLIHGRGTCSRSMALQPIELMLSAVNDLHEFASSRGDDLHERVPIRRKRKPV